VMLFIYVGYFVVFFVGIGAHRARYLEMSMPTVCAAV